MSLEYKDRTLLIFAVKVYVVYVPVWCWWPYEPNSLTARVCVSRLGPPALSHGISPRLGQNVPSHRQNVSQPDVLKGTLKTKPCYHFQIIQFVMN